MLPGPLCEHLGVGIYRFTRPCQVLTVFATTLEPAIAKPTAMGAATLPYALRTGPGGRRAGTDRIDMEVGLFGDTLMGVSLLWLGHPPTSGVDNPRLALDVAVAVAMAGACASAEAELGVCRCHAPSRKVRCRPIAAAAANRTAARVPAEPAVSGEELALFETLMGEADRFLGVDTDSPRQRRSGAALALAHASRQVRELVGSAVEPGTPVAVTIDRERSGAQLSSDHYLTLPNPLSLLVLCCSAYDEGDDITVVIQQTGLPELRRTARWPFDLATAERLTRPRDPAEPQRPATDQDPVR